LMNPNHELMSLTLKKRSAIAEFVFLEQCPTTTSADAGAMHGY
jgi:hypothetical protein